MIKREKFFYVIAEEEQRQMLDKITKHIPNSCLENPGWDREPRGPQLDLKD